MIHSLKAQDLVLSFAHLKSISSKLTIPFLFDVRYARTDNFLGQAVYAMPEAFLLVHVMMDLLKVHADLNQLGFGLLIFDGYRPWSVTKIFWDSSSPHDRQFLADPDKGSVHNRACAIDLSLYDLETKKAVLMPSDFDEMNEKSAIDYQGGEASARVFRDLLRSSMEKHGFRGIQNEWWHFNHKTLDQWPVMNFTFEEIVQAPKSPLPLQKE